MALTAALHRPNPQVRAQARSRLARRDASRLPEQLVERYEKPQKHTAELRVMSQRPRAFIAMLRAAAPTTRLLTPTCLCACALYAGWAVLTVLLLRKDLDPAGKLAFFRTCRTAAELVPCLATSPLRLALNKAQARLSPYTAKLLASLAASASTNSETAGTDVHLTVLGASQHSLPKDSITVVTLQDAAFTQQQWQEFRDSLPQYPRLRSVRLRGRNWAVSDTDTSTNLDLEQTTATTPSPIYVPVLEVMDDEEVMSHIRKNRL